MRRWAGLLSAVFLLPAICGCQVGVRAAPGQAASVAASGAYGSGPAVDLSVEEALLRALQQNPDLAVRRYGPVIAGAFEHIERGVFDPEVFAAFTYGRENSVETARSTGEAFGVRARETDAEVGVRRRLPSGTDVEVSLEHESDASNRAPDQQRARVGLTITQNLLRGRGPAVNLASVRQARLATMASCYELRAFVETLLADTKVAYWRHVLAGRRIAIFERSLEISKRQLGEIEESIQVGALPATEAAVARSEVALREQALINARSALEEARLRLLRLLGSPDPSVTLNTTTDAEIVPDPLGDLAAREALAVRSRPDLCEARLRHRERRLETIVTRDGLRPKLDFWVSLGRTGYSGNLIDSFGNLGSNTYDLAAGVTYELPVPNRDARGRHLAARATSAQAAAAVDNLEMTIRYDVHLAANEVERARQQIAATATTRASQQSTVDAEQERFAAGTSTALLVAQAQRDLLASEIAEVEAVVEYRIALVRLYLAEGTMIERHGIVMP